MGTMTVSVKDEVEDSFRKVVNSIYSGKKGSLGKAVTEAMQNWIEEQKQKEIAEEELKTLEKGFVMGKLLFKDRAELYEE